MNAIYLQDSTCHTFSLESSNPGQGFEENRRRLLSAIALAEAEGFAETRDALTEILGLLEEAHAARGLISDSK